METNVRIHLATPVTRDTVAFSMVQAQRTIKRIMENMNGNFYWKESVMVFKDQGFKKTVLFQFQVLSAYCHA